MPSTLTCPHCQATLKTAAAVAAGKKVKCPKCAATFTVGVDEDIATAVTLHPGPQTKPKRLADDDEPPRPRRERSRGEDVDDVDADDRPSRRRREDADEEREDDDVPRIRKKRRAKQKSGKGFLITMLALGAVVLIGGIVALVLVLGGGSAPDLDNPNAQKLLGKWNNPVVGATIDFHRNGTLTATVFGRTNSGKWRFIGADVMELEEPNPLRNLGGKVPPGLNLPGIDPNAATIKVQARVTFIGNDELRTQPLNFGVPQTLRRVR